MGEKESQTMLGAKAVPGPEYHDREPREKEFCKNQQREHCALD